MTFVDIAMDKTEQGYFDMVFENGVIETINSFETALNMSIFGERRASESEVSIPQFRRGWYGNSLLGFENFEMGSKLWLLGQARATQNTLNNAITYCDEALQWFIEDNYLDKVLVSANYDERNAMLINIQLIRSQNIVLSKCYKLWQNTIQDLDVAA